MANDNVSALLALMGGSGGGGSNYAVLYTEQELSALQKAQARTNIGATDALTSIPDDVKQALLNVVAHTAFVDAHGQDYYNELSAALYLGPLESISAVFTQGANIIYDTDTLDDLKQYLVVTAHYTVAGDVVVTGYDLSGTLTAGTSTITVSYGGKTATFTVTVSLGLDSICFGTKTYRDMFITDNLLSWFGNFEDDFNPQSGYTYKDSNHTSGYRWSPTSGVDHPSLTTTKCNSPTHSIDASSSSAMKYLNAYVIASFGVDYIVAAAVNITRYTAGKIELQVFGASSSVVRANISAITDGWVPAVAIGSFDQSNDGTTSINVGGLKVDGAIDLDGWIDDLVITPCPTGMTLEQATTAMQNYMEIVARGDS